jgi:hypothetical protein
MKSSLYFFGTLLLLTPAIVFAQDTAFVPLTNLPGISGVSGSPDITSLLNNIYRICIGAAAVIAVFQIMRAGVMFMFNKGSISENQEAKQLVQMSILGLILVLSPVIVFGIINPKILELNFGVDQLKTDFTGGVNGSAPSTTPGAGTNDGAVVAPPSVIPATGAVNSACPVIADNQVLTEPNLNQKEVCCGYQSNDMVSCSVKQSNNSSVTEFTRYCGCEIKVASIEYTDVWDTTNTPVRLGPLVGDKARVDAYTSGCAKAGGNIKYNEKYAGFLDKFRDCPAGMSGVPEGKKYECVLVEATCEDDS